jgi:hypothetical protein
MLSADNMVLSDGMLSDYLMLLADKIMLSHNMLSNSMLFDNMSSFFSFKLYTLKPPSSDTFWHNILGEQTTI